MRSKRRATSALTNSPLKNSTPFTASPARSRADKIELAFSADDVRRIHAEGKKVALMGVENGYPLGEDIDRVKEFYDRGARYLSLTHNGHNQLADSHTGERDGWKWNGVSPLGKTVIAEMNRFGIMVDVSHASKQSMMQTAALSKAPIIASHSAAAHALRRQPQPRRRATARAQEIRRCHPNRRL